MRPKLHKRSGLATLTFSHQGQPYNVYIHRIVAEAFG
jgi:hypothetical protein